MLTYHPYKSDKKDKKFFIITSKSKKVYFGATGYQDYTMHHDDTRKQSYIKRHASTENWNDPDTAGFWSRWLLWNKKSLDESFQDVQNILAHLKIKN